MGLFNDLKAQLNARVLYAMIGLGFIVGLVLISDYGVNIEELRAERLSLQRRLAQYGDQIDEQLWASRLEEVAALEEEWGKRYWNGTSTGIMGSQIQTHLGAISSQSELQRARPTIDEAQTAEGEQVLRVRMVGRAYEAYDAIEALKLVASSEPAIIVDEVNLIIARNNEATLTFSGLAPVEIEAPKLAVGTSDQAQSTKVTP